MALRLENKNALITGGASGIGRATAIRFAEEGANVFVADRHLAAAEETVAAVRQLGRKAVAHQVDTSDEEQVKRDGLANAGGTRPGEYRRCRCRNLARALRRRG